MTPRKQTGSPRARAAQALQRSTGALATAAMNRMDAEMAWFRELGAEDRSWVGVIIQSGIKGFIDWFRAADASTTAGETAAAIFGAAPRALTGVITLQQTVDLVRLGIETVESNVEDMVDPRDAPEVHAAVLRYAREVAFATAEVYARAAEARGAWDARLEALVVDAVLRAETDEGVLSRASALGWGNRAGVVVVLGSVPERRGAADLFDDVRRAARVGGLDAVCATQGERLVVVLGGVEDADAAADRVAGFFGPGPVVVGPVEPGLATAHASARAALAAHRAAGGWPEAPRPVRSDELLPERALAGDGQTHQFLIEALYQPLHDRATLVETLSAYFEHGQSLEATARALFVHTNTVRYRLRQVAELTGFSPSRPRHALALQIALVLGRQSIRPEPRGPAPSPPSDL